MAISPVSAGINGSDSASIGLPLLGNVSVGVNANDSVSFSGVSATLPSLTSLI